MGVLLQRGKAFWAAITAASSSDAAEQGISASRAPSRGDMTGIDLPGEALTKFPLIKFFRRPYLLALIVSFCVVLQFNTKNANTNDAEKSSKGFISPC